MAVLEVPMTAKWHSTSFPGVRYREHDTRKHGKRKDRYFSIRYQLNGKRTEEGLGWASEKWTIQKAAIELSRLKHSHVTGEGPRTLREKRELADEAQRQKEEAKKQSALDDLSVNDFFNTRYCEVAQTSKKEVSHKNEKMLYRIWIKPVIGSKPIRKLTAMDCERVKKVCQDKKKSPRTIEYVLGVIRQIWNLARREGIVQGDAPTRTVRKPKKDNRRMRFLNHEEAGALLINLKKKSKQLHDITLLSLHTGMRAGEIFSLTWADLDFERNTILIRDPKASKTRTAFMTDEVREILSSLEKGERSDYIFKDKRHNGQIKEISHVFREVVNEMKLNKGITDPRQKVVFHTCRHTFGSWLAQRGTSPFVIRELMGHSSLSMTERYSHLSEQALRDAMDTLNSQAS